MRVTTQLKFVWLAHRLLLLLFFVSDELVLVEGEVFDTAGRLTPETNMNTSLVILHLLFCFKSLLAFNCGALKFVLILDGYVVGVDLSSRKKF